MGLIGPQLSEFSWLEGVYLHGASLIERPRLLHLNFIIVYRGLSRPAQRKAAHAQLIELLQAVLPVRLHVQFTGARGVARLLDENNPAAHALLGYAESVFVRNA
ncbi:MAG: hypothetical protein ACE5HV_10805 [Acidobacteriota bacterium]